MPELVKAVFIGVGAVVIFIAVMIAIDASMRDIPESGEHEEDDDE